MKVSYIISVYIHNIFTQDISDLSKLVAYNLPGIICIHDQKLSWQSQLCCSKAQTWGGKFLTSWQLVIDHFLEISANFLETTKVFLNLNCAHFTCWCFLKYRLRPLTPGGVTSAKYLRKPTFQYQFKSTLFSRRPPTGPARILGPVSTEDCNCLGGKMPIISICADHI